MTVKYLGYRDLLVCQKSYGMAMEVFNLTISFPKEEMHALVAQLVDLVVPLTRTLQNPGLKGNMLSILFLNLPMRSLKHVKQLIGWMCHLYAIILIKMQT